MRTTRFYAALAALALSLGTTAVISAPAHADTPTTIKIDIDGKSTVKKFYGDYLGGIGGEVDFTSATSGQVEQADNGTAQLQAKRPGGS